MRRLRLFVLSCLVLSVFAHAAQAAPVKLSTVTVSPGAVTGGTSATGTATLTAAAGHNGVTVTLSSSNASVASVPASVLVPQGATSATFTITTNPVAASTNIVITGNYQATATASFTVQSPAITDLTLTNSSVMSVKETTSGYVTLSGPAPAAGTTVALSATAPAVVPSSITVPAGQSTWGFNIPTTFVSTTTTAVITATLNGNSRVATLQVTPCLMSHVNGIGFSVLDSIWIDDALPAGMSAGTSTWDTVQYDSGAQSLTFPAANGTHGATLSGATATLPVNANESLVAYFMLSDCTTPREVVLSWHVAGGDWKSAYYGQALIGGEAGMTSLGNLPQTGHWTRAEVPASQFGINGSIDGFQMQLYDGQAWFDRVGKLCVSPTAASPSSITDTIWIDDSIPNGGVMNAVWDTTQHASGSQSMHLLSYASNSGYQLAGGMNPGFDVGIGENLVLWVLLDSCLPPSGFEIDWFTDDNNTYGRATWGTATGGVHVGPVPPAGEWVRLEVPAHDLGIELRAVTSVYAGWYGNGSFWVDAIGKSGTACVAAAAPAPSIPPGDTVIVDDSTPAGGSITGTWDASQHASGALSVRGTFYESGQHDVAVRGFSRQIQFNENLVVYVLLNECVAPPSELAVEWKTDGWEIEGVYWGTTTNWSEQSSLRLMSTTMLPEGAWQRIEIPARTLGLEGKTITDVVVRMQGAGQAWIDHVAVSGTPCYLGTATPPSSFPADTVWIDDAAPSGSYSSVLWDTTRVASGTKSIVEGFYGLGTGWGQIDDIAAPGTTTQLQSTDNIVFYMLVNECAPPSEIQVRFGLWSGDVKNAYWGTTHGNMGEQLYMGPVPAGGSWMRVEIPASALSIIPGTYSGSVRNLFFFSVDGQTWFDRIGKSTP